MTLSDVVIIGAGAAGSSAAFHLAKAGKKVIILEKTPSSNEIKPCGGGIASSVQELFPFDLSPIVEQVINRVEFTWFLSDKIIADLPGESPFWIVNREKLDSFITNKAIEEGAKLITPFKVTELRRDGKNWLISSETNQQISAKSIVIADGSNSKWSQKFSLGPKKPNFASTTSVRLEGNGNLKEGATRFEFGLVRHGFAWAFPMKKYMNVGVGTFIGKGNADSQEILKELLPTLGFDSNAGIRKNCSLRVWNGHHNLHGDGIVAVGDAASLCDPFLAEGLRPALLSGKEAAASLNLWLEGGSHDLNNYTNAMKHKWGNSMAWGKRISQVFYRFPKIGYQLGIKRPTAPQRIAEILSGKMSYEDIAQRVIKRLLFKQ